MKVPSGLQILVVERHNTYPDERCILGVIERGRKIGSSGHPAVAEYYNFVHFALTVTNIPVAQRLAEYLFSTSDYSDGAVKYIGQPKSEIATQMGYLGETTDSWNVTSQGGGTCTQRKFHRFGVFPTGHRFVITACIFFGEMKKSL
ncbi:MULTISPECIES: hypothetical protein [Burkholderiaceae]|uniref:hypothetical protein n=1 Tax=Burkholderiaceae TaxID=119060 RepID=UPI001113A6FC|nr:hypothetical protein [Ralstonia sp. 25mfcol4.1]